MFEKRQINFTAVVLALPALCSIALAGDGPPSKAASTSFRGTKAGQVRSDNGLKMKLVWCPPGKFTMGSPKDEKGRFDNEDQVQVTLTKGFWLGQHHVTQSEWQQVMQTAPWSDKLEAKEGDNYPATYVSWEDATKFCEKLTQSERRAGRLPADWKYTLPTEAQWEYACRAGTKSRFSFGDDESNLDDYAWFDKNSGRNYGFGGRFPPVGDSAWGVHLVGQKKANPWGLYDMHGNIWQWCSDCFTEKLAGGTDPQGPSEADSSLLFDKRSGVVVRRPAMRLNRGGSWRNPERDCRSARRFRNSSGRVDFLGFRVAAVQTDK